MLWFWTLWHSRSTSLTDESRLGSWINSSLLWQCHYSSVFDLVWTLQHESVNSVSTPPLLNAPGKFHSSFVVLFFSLSPPTAVEIQKNINRLCLCNKESKQVKKQRCYSLESMLVSLQTPLPEVYSGGSLRSLHYSPSQPRDPARQLPWSAL